MNTTNSAPTATGTRAPVRTSALLADGREIIYFDDTVDPVRVLHDPRDLPVVEPTPVARYDILVGEWVGIAGHRQTRTHLPPASECPLCPSTSQNQTEIPSADYDVVVFENRFPSFGGSHEVDLPPAPTDVFQEIPGRGRCEVVCFTSDHDADFASLGHGRVRTVIEAWVDRTRALAQVPGVEQVYCFTNQGTEIGVTLAHPHGQIYGYPFVTAKTAAMLRQAQQHRDATGTNLFRSIIDAEIADGTRIVTENKHWVAFVPFAARWPLEVHLYPRRQVPDLPATTDAERESLADIYLEILRRMGGVFDDTLPAIAGWHQAPVNTGREEFWLHLQVLTIRRDVGKLKYLAGSESGMGTFINDIAPETAAQRLRDVDLGDLT